MYACTFQECFDATTRVTTAMRRMGTKLIALKPTESLRVMADRACSLCKAMVEPSDALEGLMRSKFINPEKLVAKAQVAEMMDKIAPIYKEMVTLYNEMCQLLRSQKGAIKDSGLAINLKPLKL